MAFDAEKFKKKLSSPKTIQSEQSGHMFLYEALLSPVQRLGSSTLELSLKIIWYHHADRRPRCTSIHNYASVIHHGEITDFAKILNGFLGKENAMSSHVDMDELIALAKQIVDTINTEEVYCYCHINNKNRIGKRIEKFEVTNNIHPILNRSYCDTFKDLTWFIPEGYENEGKFKKLQKLNFKRSGLYVFDKEKENVPPPNNKPSTSFSDQDIEEAV